MINVAGALLVTPALIAAQFRLVLRILELPQPPQSLRVLSIRFAHELITKYFRTDRPYCLDPNLLVKISRAPQKDPVLPTCASSAAIHQHPVMRATIQLVDIITKLGAGDGRSMMKVAGAVLALAVEAMFLQTNSGIQRFKDSTVADLLGCRKGDVSANTL
eukprot:gene8599-34041_t